MELFNNFRLRIGNSILRKKIEKTNRKVSYSNINLVKSIGVVWDASNIEEFTSLSRFYQKMHEKNIEIKILGYFPEKNLPDPYTAVRYLTIIRKNEVNLFYTPVSSETNSFINNRFEVLIDINFKRVFPLRYISSLSKAGFKVGLSDSETAESPFDLMLEIKSPVNIENYLDQVIHYLEMIKTGSSNNSI